ncbi:Hypothetical predicted protein [Mytilus galloprovincialis]|uniref:Peptidase C14 caspase domain-containing protein n=1 Tax=Mytilus galloprovincialis TaxID=29158 RepID=A0A8B6GMH8_MYTGA|nr:Hypothetical predicted protein [Mytilus galloprovincialis]
MSILARIFPLKEDGASDDYEKFTSFWSQVEGCEVENICMKDYSPPRIEKDFENQLESLRKKFEEGKKYKYLVLAVSSHGIEKDTDGKDVTFEIVWGRDKRYKVNKLLEKFKEVKEQKIFIMQMCRNRSDKTTVTLLGKDQGVMHHSS